MKKRIVLLVSAVILIFLAGCIRSSPDSFSFSYSIGQGEIAKGGRIAITVTLTNNSDKEYSYSGSETDFRATVKLFCKNGETEYIVPAEPVPSTDDIGKHVIAPHESRAFTFYFSIPDDAPSGDYNLSVAYQGSGAAYSKIFTLSD